MKLENIASSIEDCELIGDGRVEIERIEFDSRLVQPASLFVAIKGFKADGHDFIEEAKKRGASALMVEKDGDYGLPYLKVKDSRLGLAQVGAAFYDYPAQKMKLIGITGTNGKTTTAFMIEKILQLAGEKVGLLGTIVKRFGQKEFAGDRTTPESLELQRDFSYIYNKGGSHLVMEVSSHALALKRIAGLEYDVGVFTNISPEHGEFHKSFQDYVDMKISFFKNYLKENGLAVVNKDDTHSNEVINAIDKKIITYSLEGQGDVNGKIMEMTSSGLTLLVETKSQKEIIKLNLTGSFNGYNSLAAISVGLALGLDLKKIKEGLEALKGVPGRFESLDAGDITVIIDFAHSPDGLENLLKNAAKLKTKRLIIVFGCGGDRDKSKRPKMGKIAGNWADLVIVSSDNPRSENLEEIIADIMVGLEGKEEVLAIADRREAIFKAVALAEEGDLIVIAGKGHETEQIIGEQKLLFDDKSVAKEAILELRGGKDGGSNY